MAVSSYLRKLKRGLGLAFGAYFLHGFFHANPPFLILYHLIVYDYTMSYLFSVSRYQIKRVIKFSFRQMMTS